MKQKLLIGLGILLLVLTIACGSLSDGRTSYWHNIAIAETPSTESGIMIVFYTISDGMYLFWCGVDAQIIDNGDTWDVISDQVNASGVDKATVTYGYYKYKVIELVYDEGGSPLPLYIQDLNLEVPTAGDLPRSGHFARLDDIHPSDVLKAEVSRYWNGQWFTGIRCLVSLQVYQAYGVDLQIGDYVWVYYTNDPRPGHEHEEVPIVIDKVVYP